MANKESFFPVESLGVDGIRIEKNRVMSFNTHSHVYYEMLLYQPFKGFLTINGHRYSVERPTAVLLTPEDFHSTMVQQDGEYIKLCMKGNLLEDENFSYRPAILIDDGSGLITRLFERAYEKRELVAYAIAVVRMAAMEIMTSGEPLVSSAICRSTHLVSKAMGFINQEFTKSDVSLATIADYLHVTPQHLSSVFSKTAGVTFGAYLSNKRLTYAALLLLDGNESVTSICFAVGYQNVSHFVRSFQKRYGISPSEYRRTRGK